MRTFADIAQEARTHAPVLNGLPGQSRTDLALELIAELAEALDVLEYNTAYWLATMNLDPDLQKPPELFKAVLPEAVKGWLLTLRSEAYRRETEGYAVKG